MRRQLEEDKRIKNLACAREWKRKNKEYCKQKRAEYYQNNKEKEKTNHLIWCENNKEKLKDAKKQYDKNYRERNTEKIRHHKQSEEFKREKNRKARERYHSDKAYRIEKCLRASFLQALKLYNDGRKTTSIKNLIGCSIHDLVLHIQNKFKEGMTWDNYGDWHIDHIYPCSRFDLNSKREQLMCFHYTNLQPLWASENIKKSNKVL